MNSNRINRSSPPVNYCNPKAFICTGCKNNYDFITRNNVFMGRVPLILNCKHTVCEDCVKTKIQDKQVICPDCKESSSIASNNKKLQELFPVNFYVLGCIYYMKPQTAVDNKFKPAGFRFMSKEKGNFQNVPNYYHFMSETPEELCSQKDCNKPASLKCADCAEVYCEKCCGAFHKIARGFRSHKITPLNLAVVKEVTEACATHADGKQEYHCETCNEDICCYCIIAAHKEHKWQKLDELTEDDRPKFLELIESAEGVLKQMQATQKVVAWNLKQTSVVSNIGSSETALAKRFTELYARLQLLEKKMHEDIFVAKNFNAHRLSSINEEIVATIPKLSAYLDAAKSLITKNNGSHKINVRNLTDKLSDALKLPCHLIGQKQTTEHIDFTCGDDIFDNLEEKFIVKIDTDNEFRLVCADDLPEDYEPLTAPEESEVSTSANDMQGTVNDSYKTLSGDSSCSGLSEIKSHSRTSSVSELPEFSLDSYMREKLRSQDRHSSLSVRSRQQTNNCESVKVLHINSPDSFYVHLLKDSQMLERLTSEVTKHVTNLAPCVYEPEIGKLYAVKYEEKGSKFYWCRGRLLETKGDLTSRDLLYTVLYVDFGNTQKVKKECLRHLSQELCGIEPCAIHCKLYDIYPAKGEWDQTSNSLMAQIIDRNNTVLYTVSDSNDVREVDLLCFLSDGDSVSVRDALLFTGYGIPHTNADVKHQYPKTDIVKLYRNDNKFKENDKAHVIITHVVHPAQFYVQIADCQSDLQKLSEQMTKFYSPKSKNMIYNPKKGMNVVVKYSDNGESPPNKNCWYRAEIIDTAAGRGFITAFLVDNGKILTLPWTSARKLQMQFTYLECQVVMVNLAAVAPLDEEAGWSTSATEMLQKYVQQKTKLLMTAHKTGKPLSVVLFEEFDSMDICINAKLVEEGVAKSTGSLSTKLEWVKEIKSSTSALGFESDLVKSIQSLTTVDRSADADVTSNKSKTVIKKSVKVVLAVNPSEIYIIFEDEKIQNNLQEMHTQIQEHYKTECNQSADRDWVLEEKCIVLDEEEKQYYRGQVIKKLENEKYKVRLLDNMKEIEVTKTKMFLLENQFRIFPNFVMRCHLSGITPAGDPNKWSMTAVEFLEEIFENNKNICMTKSGPIDRDRGSLAVTMWYTEFIPGGPLEPSRSKLHCINKMLLENGLAMRKKVTDEVVEAQENQDSDSSSCKDEIRKPDDIKSVTEEESVPKKKVDWNELIEEELGATAYARGDYLPALPIKTKNFTVTITYIGNDGTIYVQVCQQGVVFTEMAKKMKIALDQMLRDPSSLVFLPGDLCSVFYKETNLWYRGKILQREPDGKYRVHMVDFGNEESCLPEELRSKAMYLDVPSFVHKIRFYNVYARNDEWLASDLDMLHDIFNNAKETVVSIKGEQKVNEPSYAEVFVDGKLNVNETIVKLSKNLSHKPFMEEIESDDEEDVVIIKETTTVSGETVEEHEGPSGSYTSAPLDHIDLNTPVELAIISILDYNKLIVEILNDKVNNDVFAQLSIDMQSSAASQPVLHNLEIKRPCIARFSEDGLWYRAQIEEIYEDGTVQVWFVDFGNFETVTKSSLRVIREEWTRYPLVHYKAELSMVVLKDKTKVDEVTQFFEPFIATMQMAVVNSIEPLKLSLIDKDTGDFLYQELLDNDLLELKEE